MRYEDVGDQYAFSKSLIFILSIFSFTIYILYKIALKILRKQIKIYNVIKQNNKILINFFCRETLIKYFPRYLIWPH